VVTSSARLCQRLLRITEATAGYNTYWRVGESLFKWGRVNSEPGALATGLESVFSGSGVVRRLLNILKKHPVATASGSDVTLRYLGKFLIEAVLLK